jgi:bacterioferritin-associated ferredoxin
MTKPGVLVCRCEEVYEDAIRAAIASGATTPREVKLRTRVGMGVCQGRVCRTLMQRLIGPSLPTESMSYRSPVRLVRAAEVLAQGWTGANAKGK